MTESVDPDDLAALATGFEAATADGIGAGPATAALFELGWDELLAAARTSGAAMAFTVLGATGSAASLLDDVVARAVGLDISLATTVVLPAPHRSTPPGRRVGERVVVDGIVSAHVDDAATAVVAIGAPGATELVSVDASWLRGAAVDALDPGHAYRRARVELEAAAVIPLAGAGTWGDAVVAARVALAHQLVAAARTMLELARQHTLDRVQFGRPIASFQAVRHKLAASLVEIEGAAAAAGAAVEDADPLVAAVAKSLAGHAARTTATHAQQVLAGVGFTTDHVFHRWLKRVLVLDVLWGSATSLPADIGADLLAHRRSTPVGRPLITSFSSFGQEDSHR